MPDPTQKLVVTRFAVIAAGALAAGAMAVCRWGRRYMIKKRFGKRLRSLIEIQGYSFSTLAAKLGVTESAVEKWCYGQNFPEYAVLDEMADLFGVTLDVLMGRSPLVLGHPAPENKDGVPSDQ